MVAPTSAGARVWPHPMFNEVHLRDAHATLSPDPRPASLSPSIAWPTAPARALTSGLRPASTDASGQISGKVTSAASNAPIEGIEVCGFSEEPPFASACAFTNARGEYTLTELPKGKYVVEFSSPENSDLNYIAQYYDERASYEEAEVVTLGTGATVTGIDARLEVGGEITGSVSSFATKSALTNIEICAFDEELGAGACATSDASGVYTIRGLPSGTYKVAFLVPESESLNYAPQYYKGKSLLKEAETVAVEVERITSGIDAALLEGGQILGRVTAAATGAPLEGIEVCAIRLSEGLVRCTSTDATGAYRLMSLGAGEYDIGFVSKTGEYVKVEVKPVAVTAGHETEPVNAALMLAVPQELSPPTIIGSPVEGQTLKVTHGEWTGHPSTYSDEWYLCPTQEGGLCTRVGEGETYTVSADDVGHFIGVIEKAYNSAGESKKAFSRLTALVTAAPSPEHEQGGQAGGTPVPAAAVPSNAGTSGVLASTISAASAAQLKVMLSNLLAPTGKNSKISALLKHGGYALSFNALALGEIAVSWYLVPKGAHLSRAKPVLVARGHVTVNTAGPAKLTIRLTGSGRALLKHANRLVLTAQGSMAPTGENAVSATKSFVLKR